MNNVIVNVKGGIAEIVENHDNVDVQIFDCDGEEANLTQDEFVTEMKNALTINPAATIIKVWRGIADLQYCPEDVHVTINDYDNY